MGQRIPIMTPAPGERLRRFVGDRVRFTLRMPETQLPHGWQARLRTNLGRAAVLRREIIQAHAQGLPLAGASWRDLPMIQDADGWFLDLPLAEVGYFKAKPYLLDPRGWQHWPEGPDVGIAVHPDACRTANTLYCAFPRLFGSSRSSITNRNENLDNQIQQIEQHGFTIIPPSGKLRDLIQCLPHIIDVLGCRILQLLPIHPTPTTYARFGQFGSPYAAIDLTEVDPAVVVFDKRTTGVDQFRELSYATHLRGGRVFLDIVINHTGWGSFLQENFPEWFLRDASGTFVSPGAWGVTWEDLVELKHNNVALWDKLADMFLVWCRRGVDGFRCDAGYKVPVQAWQYIIARVQQEFPETMFLLEGLGGSWEATEALLTEGGMQWAYSELFQNYSGREVATYLDYALRQSDRTGMYLHYSETHDNPRLAAGRQDNPQSADTTPDRTWSLLRNYLCALTSVNGGFAFTCGVEWLATEKIRVHGSTGLAWGRNENLVAELTQLNRLISDHPCFFDGAKLTRLSPTESAVYALLRESADGEDRLLVLVNTDPNNAHTMALSESSFLPTDTWTFDLLGQSPPARRPGSAGELVLALEPGAAHCLSAVAQPRGISGNDYRRARAQAAWAIQNLSEEFSVGKLGPFDWRALARLVEQSPAHFLTALRYMQPELAQKDLQAALEHALRRNDYPQVIHWTRVDRSRITPVPPGHWLLIEDTVPFRASLRGVIGAPPKNIESIPALDKHIACIPPERTAATASASASQSRDRQLFLERYADDDQHVEATIRFLAEEPKALPATLHSPPPDSVVLLTNGIGGMARIRIDLGRVRSKYDCVLAANLHPSLPVDRHVLAKRIRAWVNADGFISPLDLNNLAAFEVGPPAVWHFVTNAGDGRTVEIEMSATMDEGRNTTVFHFSRPTAAQATGKQLPTAADVRLTLRVDIEDRNFHSETKRNGGAEHHFSNHIITLEKSGNADNKSNIGFSFVPASDRQLRVFADAGTYHPQPEWSENLAHDIEQSRGQCGTGDAYSPGWFDVPLTKGGSANLVLTAETNDASTSATTSTAAPARSTSSVADPDASSLFEAQLLRAVQAFVVRRGTGKTVIAGYPWFLDWGRDTFICARGLLAAGMTADVRDIVLTFARFEKDGTLPNTIHGEDASNRNTSDAPLWFGLVCEELSQLTSRSHTDATIGTGRDFHEVLASIASHYVSGTPNRIRMDPKSGLIWSPAHFTWMDTNYPAGSAREGYPIEIQALWIRLLRHLAQIESGKTRDKWNGLADRALESLEKLFWLEDRGFYADVLLAMPGKSAAEAVASDALRSNSLFAVSLGLVKGDRAKRNVAAALRHLVVPGALRSLAPLPVSVALPIYGNDGGLLNDPNHPYWPRYEGDEDTRRKPAYHNGTAWTWTLPILGEALARAWDFTPEATAAARAYVSSVDQLMNLECLGQIPEILDGDAPHKPRGCDAQAWGVTEVLRVWKLLNT